LQDGAFEKVPVVFDEIIIDRCSAIWMRVISHDGLVTLSAFERRDFLVN
jgi:hypothetical protein